MLCQAPKEGGNVGLFTLFGSLQKNLFKWFNLGVSFTREGQMKSFLYFVLLSLFFSHAAYADEAGIKTAMEKRFPYEQVISVHKTPYFGLV